MRATKQEKNLKKEIRFWAGKAYERLLNKALRELDADFSEWRAGKIDPWELSDRIHKFHDGISRRLYVLAGDNHGRTILLEAIIQGEIRPDELSQELSKYLRPRIESFKRFKEEIAADILTEEEDKNDFLSKGKLYAPKKKNE